MAVAALAAAAALAHGCGSSSDGEPGGGAGTSGGDSGAGAAGGGIGAAGGSGGSGLGGKGGSSPGDSGGAGGCAAGLVPPNTPPDWELYPGYCECPLYYPGAKGALPDPVEWEPCPTPGPANATCRRMKTPWTKTSKNSLTVFPNFWFDKSANTAYLQFGRINLFDDEENRFRYHMVANAEGPILTAFYEGSIGKPSCTLADQALREGKYAFTAIPVAIPGPGQVEAVLAGDIGSLPSVVISNPVDTSHTSWEVSSSWLVRKHHGEYWARHWGSSAETLVQSPALDPEGLSGYFRDAVGDAVFWEVGGLKYKGIMSWTEAAGGRSLVRYLGDYTQGAGNFATDGTDMVWTHGEGKQPNDTTFPTRSIMTAPFTTDPEIVKKTAKRLRSDPGQLTVYPYAIGCGHVARTIYENLDAGSGASEDLLIVRLSDGVSWIVDAPPVSTGVMFMTPLGFTCEEVFGKVQFADDAVSIVRIRLDSLGPGIPPD